MASPLNLLTKPGGKSTPLTAISLSKYPEWLAGLEPKMASWLKASAFKADAGNVCAIPGEDGNLSSAVVGLGVGDDPWATGNLSKVLPKGTYRLHECLGAGPDFPTWAALAWALGGYSFSRYKTEPQSEKACLEWPAECNVDYVRRAVAGAALTRDLVNTPASDMLPDALEAVARKVAEAHGATVRVVSGEDLITENYPMIHAVGRASAVAPRLIDFVWGDDSAPKVTLVGKGVCFDSGGLDIKPSSAMALMKKDMGGAATVLGLADMVMSAKLPVRLRVLVPAVENAIAGNAFRPGDILKTRKGITVEIGNTDAEGRLVLGDALTDAVSEKPALLVDCATLTGAARSALGPEIPAMFTNDENLAMDLLAAAQARHDPLWRMPLWSPYRRMIDSKAADINNAGDSPFAGAITAALFLKEFAGAAPWIHIDLFAWNPSDRPGRPAGGEAMAQRALFDLISTKFK